MLTAAHDRVPTLTLLILLFLAPLQAVQAQDKPQGLTPQANQTDSTLTAETRSVFRSISLNILKAAREMPESSYNMTPEKGVRNFGQLVTHIANVQETLCANINGHPAKTEPESSTKEEMLKHLSESIAGCQMAFDELSAENATKHVTSPAGEVTHIVALVYIITHASEEYGQMSIYLRLAHLKPPTSDDATGGAAGKG